MVHLKYVDPFEEKMMNSISCFSEERSFYDCINRRFLQEQAFQNLEYSFHTYFLTGDSNEWIGYVLFFNSDLIEGYSQLVYQETLVLLQYFQEEFGNEENYHLFEKLKKLIMIEKQSTRLNPLMEDIISALSSLEVSDTSVQLEMLSNYHKKLQDYLNEFPDYYYLDIVISLPLEEENYLKRENEGSDLNVDLLAERKYYGFIQEVLSKVEKVIEQNFKDTPILIKQKSDKIIFANRENVPDGIPVIKKILK